MMIRPGFQSIAFIVSTVLVGCSSGVESGTTGSGATDSDAGSGAIIGWNESEMVDSAGQSAKDGGASAADGGTSSTQDAAASSDAGSTNGGDAAAHQDGGSGAGDAGAQSDSSTASSDAGSGTDSSIDVGVGVGPDLWVDIHAGLGGNGSLDHPFNSLADALAAVANGSADVTIHLKGGSPATDYTLGAAISLRSGVTLTGDGANLVHITAGGTCADTTCAVNVAPGAKLLDVTVSASPGIAVGVLLGADPSNAAPGLVVNVTATNAVTGILAEGASVLDKVTATGNSGSGIVTRALSTVTNSTCSNNGGNGLLSQAATTISHLTASNNGAAGVVTNAAADLSTIVASGNGADGVLTTAASTLNGITATANVGNGIATQADATLSGITATANAGNGLFTSGVGNVSVLASATPSHFDGNSGDGILATGLSALDLHNLTCNQNKKSGMQLATLLVNGAIAKVIVHRVTDLVARDNDGDGASCGPTAGIKLRNATLLHNVKNGLRLLTSLSNLLSFDTGTLVSLGNNTFAEVDISKRNNLAGLAVEGTISLGGLSGVGNNWGCGCSNPLTTILSPLNQGLLADITLTTGESDYP